MSIALATEQQLDHRLIGASDAAAILGVDKYRRPMDVWLDKAQPPADRSPPSEAAAWGTALEPVVRGKYALDTGRMVHVPTASLVLDGWLRATPDGCVSTRLLPMPAPGSTVHLVQEIDPFPGMQERLGIDGLLEVKTCGFRSGDEWDDGVPERYEIQVRTQMAVCSRVWDCNIAWCDVVCLIGGQRYVGPFRVERDPAREHAILTDLREFWRLVETNTPPSVDGGEAWGRYASSRMKPTRVTMDADQEMRGFLCDMQQLRAQQDKLEAQAEEIKTQLLLRLSAAGATAINGGDDLGTVTAYQPAGRMAWKEYAEWLESVIPPDARLAIIAQRKRFTGAPGNWSLRFPRSW